MLRGEDLLAAAAEAISDYGFSMTESFAARVRHPPPCSFPFLPLALVPVWPACH